MKIKDFKEIIEIPQGIKASAEDGILIVSKENKMVKKAMKHKEVKVSVDGNNIIVSFKKGDKREKMMANTFISHIKTMFRGVVEGHTYKLKICSGHFPINVSLSGSKFTVSNFLGEKKPRETKIRDGANVKIEGDHITVSGVDRDLVSQTAAQIEMLTRVRGRDLRIFQDGIYIINKDGVAVA
jgi:large subunit ribosomal protein L6